MDSLGEYVIMLSSASIVAGVILSLIKGSGHEALIRLLCGVFLTVTALTPISRVQIPDFSDLTLSFSDQAEQAVLHGENLAEEAMADIIKAETEAYILDKAAALHLELDVTVRISDGIPESVCLQGAPSPEGKLALSQIITEELGISKENQQWIGRK